MWGSDRLRAGRQEVGKCSTRGESWGMYITFASAKIANKAEPTLALKPRGDVTRKPKQGYQWPQKGHVSAKNLKKNKKKNKYDLVESSWSSGWLYDIIKECSPAVKADVVLVFQQCLQCQLDCKQLLSLLERKHPRCRKYNSHHYYFHLGNWNTKHKIVKP